jgi:two-component system, cell cycle sensor histidine kinase and response regulator CckA
MARPADCRRAIPLSLTAYRAFAYGYGAEGRQYCDMTMTAHETGLFHPELLLKAQQLAHVATWVQDLRTNTLEWSDEAFRQFGLEPGAIAPTFAAFMSFVHPLDRDALSAAIDATMKRGGPFDIVIRITRVDRTQRVVHSIGMVEVDDTGALNRLYGVGMDITERNDAQVALRHSELTFRSLFEQSAVGFVFADSDHRYIKANPSFAKFLGYEPSELVGRSYADFTDAADMEMAREMLAAHQGEHGSFGYEKRYRRRDGTVVWGRASITRLKNDDGSADGYLAVVEDITEQRKLHDQLFQAQKMEALGQLAGGIAHDFNNLLTIISACATFLLEETNGNDSAATDAREIMTAARRAAALTRQLLAFGRRQLLQPQLVDVNTCMDDLFKTLRRLIDEGITLSVSTEAAPSMVEIDVHQFEQILINLVVNARDAVDVHGTITVETGNAPHGPPGASAADARPCVVISVADNGYGMSADVQARIFEPFFTTKEVGKGTGLGLATVFGIVKQSGGHIEVESAVGRGSIFRVYLPIVATSDASEAHRNQVEPSFAGSETILLVEDESAVRAIASRTLRRLGYQVVEARHGGDAASISSDFRGQIDLLVTDIIMPKMGGRSLARIIRKERGAIPIVYMSGYTDDELLRRGILEAGAVLLRKPFTPMDLAKTVRELLDAHGGTGQTRGTAR